jgi:hypothetical protein
VRAELIIGSLPLDTPSGGVSSSSNPMINRAAAPSSVSR